MKILRITLVALCAVCGLWTSVFGWRSVPVNNFADSSGRELYQQNCARCHGADGQGQTELGKTYDVPNIADVGYQKKHSDAKISRKIVKGGGGMPAFGKKLSQKDIAALTIYVRTLKK